MKTRTEHLIALNAKADKLLEFDWYVPQRVNEDISDEELDKIGGVAIHPGRLAATAGIGAGGVLGHQAIQRAGGYGTVGRKTMAGGSAAITAGKRIVNPANAATSLKNLLSTDALARIKKSAAKAFTHAMCSRTERLIQLNAKADWLIEFADTGTALLIGNPLTSALNARKGKKWDAYKDAYGNQVGDTIAGGLTGVAAGTGIGAVSSLHPKIGARFARSAAKRGISKAGVGAIIGAVGGGYLGSGIGHLHGSFGARAREIRHRYDAE